MRFPGSVRQVIVLALVLAAAAGGAGASEVASGQGGSYTLGVGSFNTAHGRPSAGIGVEYRMNQMAWRPAAARRFSLIPTLGITGSSRNAIFGYAGLRSDFDLTDRWRLTPGFAVGAYERNGDINLGGMIEFRSSLDVSRAMSSGMRV